jgi:HEAT repeat protein
MKKMRNDYKIPKKFLKSLLVILLIIFTITLFISMVSCSSQEATIKRLIRNLGNERTEVQEDSIKQLSSIGRPAIPYLHEAIKSDNQLIKKNIVVILGNIKDPSSIAILIEQFSEEIAEINSTAVMSVSNFGESALGPLFNVLSSDNELVRKNALDAINKIGGGDIGLWIEALNNTHEDIQLTAISKLRDLKNDIAVEPLLKMLNSSNEEVVYNTVEALGVFKNPDSVEPLIKLLDYGSSQVVLKSIEVLSVINDDKTVVPLIDLLNSKDLTIISSTIKALGGFKDPRAVDKLIEVLYTWSDNSDITDQITTALISIGKPAVEPLIALLQKEDPDYGSSQVVLKSIEVLSVINDDKAVLPLIDLLNSKDLTIISSTIKALGGFKDPRAVDKLIEVLYTWSDNSDITDQITTALISIGKPAVEPLIALLQKEDPLIREIACDILGKIGDVSAVEPLLEALNDEDFNVRFSAGEALNKLETTPEIESLIEAMQEKNLKIVAKYYVFYILRGESGTEPILISALDKYGDVTMAEDFLNCGNNQLETGAEKWAERNGYEVVPGFGGNTSPQWGAG